MRASRRLLIAAQPHDGGVPRHLLEFLGALDPTEWRVDVACPRGSLLWTTLAGRPGVTVHEIGRHRRPALGDLRSLARLLPLVARADVVHGHSSKAGFLVRLAAALCRRTDRCLFSPHGWSFWAARGPLARFYLLLERLAARWCRLIVVVCEAEREAGLGAGIGRPSQYRVVLNGVDLDRFGREPAPTPGRVLAVGRLTRAKRPDVAVRAFRLVLDRHPAAELHLVGDGPDRRSVERLVAELGLDGAVVVHGERPDIEELYPTASCLLLASEWEACPLSVVEAMAAGVPVVATRVGGVPELVSQGATGLLVAPGDEPGLADAVSTLLSDPRAAAQLGAAGREAARARLSRRRMVAEVLRLYDEVAPPAGE